MKTNHYKELLNMNHMSDSITKLMFMFLENIIER